MTNEAGRLADRIDAVSRAFLDEFGEPPEFIVSAPGRVNLIGEHTDYNEGFVLPVAINREMVIAAKPDRARKQIFNLLSLDYDERQSLELDPVKRERNGSWSDYLVGVLYALFDRGGSPSSFDAVLSGSVPQGAGLSSSAAFEVAVAALVNEIDQMQIEKRELALIAQRAENQFIGVQCGIMDQFISAMAEPDAALLIDCRDLTYESHCLNLASRGMVIVITDTGVKRGLQDSQYNARREECRRGVELVSRVTSQNAASLRDIKGDDLKRARSELPELSELIERRCRHVITENERVLRAVKCLDEGDIEEFGRLMNQSHTSLSRDYEVSCPELDLLVGLSQKHPGVVGARMTGAGFGGATVAIMKESAVESFSSSVVQSYESESGRRATVYVLEAAAGVAALHKAVC